MPEVDRVLGNREKLMRPSYRGRRVQVGEILADPARQLVVSGPRHTRAFVEIQTGCDHRCTFCVIPLGRGDSVSMRPHAIVDAITRAVDSGQREVVLTGVDLTSYAPSLGALVGAIIARVPALPRLRLSSLDPAEIDDALFELIVCEPRLMPHVHLSLQSGSDMILKRMKRRHSARQAVDLVQRLKAERPDIAVGADLIAGFPTETDAMHADSLRVITECDVVFAHVFPYSSRARTPAARMPQLAASVAHNRARALREAADARRDAWLSTLVGSVQSVLIERSGTHGHAQNFAKVALDAAAIPGTVVKVAVTGSTGDTLTGSPR